MTVRQHLSAFLDGVGRSADVFGVRGPGAADVLRGQAADSRAIAGDWRRVGGDIRTAMAAHAASAERPAKRS